MKYVILMFAFLGFNCNAQNITECSYLKLSIENLMQDARVIHYIHSDIKTRLPYNFKTKLLCETESTDFNIISVDNKTEKSVINIRIFEISGNNIKLNLYYKENGTGINSLLKINSDKSVEIIDMMIYEN